MNREKTVENKQNKWLNRYKWKNYKKRLWKKEVTVIIIKRASGRCELVKEYSEIHSGALGWSRIFDYEL